MTQSHTTTTTAHPSKVLRGLAMFASYLFHPALVPSILMLALYRLSPTAFAGISPQAFGKLMLPVVLNTFFFPVVATLLVKAVGFIDSIHMKDSKDRIIPLIITMIFYFWLNNVFSNLKDAPMIAHVLTLGSFWSIIAIFMCNIFFKISMHTTAAGGVLGLMIVLLLMSPVNMIAPLFIALFVGGIVGTARMILGAHTRFELWSGYIVGLLVQLGAYWYLA